MTTAYTELLIAVFLLAVIFQKNEQALVKLLKEEGPFVKWAISFGIVVAVLDQFGKPGQQFMTLVYVALLMIAVKKNPDLFDSIVKILK